MINIINRGGIGVIVWDLTTGQILLGNRKDGQGWGIAEGVCNLYETMEECATRVVNEDFSIDREIKEFNLKGEILSIEYIKDRSTSVVSNIYSICCEKESVELSINDKYGEFRWFNTRDIVVTDVQNKTLIAVNKFYLEETDLVL